MGNVVFPGFVEEFIETTNSFLGVLNTTLEEVSDDSDSRTYRISAANNSTEIRIERTIGLPEQPVSQFRCTVISELSADWASFVSGKDDELNRYATLGALVSTESGASVITLCPIEAEHRQSIAGVLAVAAVHACPSILGSCSRALGRESSPVVERLSAWTDLDFEQIHSDYAHSGASMLSSRRLTMHLNPFGILTLDATHNNPYWGGGLLCLSRFPEHLLSSEGAPIEINAMNLWDYFFTGLPTFGGWCREGSDVVFAQFFPNLLKGLPHLTDLIISWAKFRAGFAPPLAKLSARTHVSSDTSPDR
jgi:hypothetical protein